MKSRESSDRDSLLRPEAELPHFANDRRLTFPYRHTALWADADLTSLRRYVDDFSKVVKLLAKAGLANVRNGLEHKRPESEFPRGGEMFECVAKLGEAFEISDKMRLYPKVFWLRERTKSQSGTSEFRAKDYAGGETEFFGPSLAVGHRGVDFGEPFLICPGNLLSVPNALITFRPVSWNEYTRYWQGYPRRRALPLDDARETSDGSFDSASLANGHAVLTKASVVVGLTDESDSADRTSSIV